MQPLPSLEANFTAGRGLPPWPVPLVCPGCKSSLHFNPERVQCTNCQSIFLFRGGFPDFILGERFEDATDEAQKSYEEQSNEDSTRHYWSRLFKDTWPSCYPAPRLLSLGCGIGTDVDFLSDAGFDCVGIDCGNRSSTWTRRTHKERLFLANGKHLPFENGTFDAVFCGCVFPHVGTVGDTRALARDYYEARLALAREMIRVLKCGGRVFAASPNRLFPLDLFHGRKAGSYKPTLNSPRSRFLLSLGDYRRLLQAAGCTDISALPVEGYWGFIRSKNSLQGRILGLPVRFLFWLVSRRAAKPLRASRLSPWIVITAWKPPSEAL